MKRRGPDSLQGWFIVLVTCIISTLMYGCAGLSGMLFVASMTRYNVDRNQASFPYILSYVLQAVTGPFAGFFAKRFGLRNVVMIGSILGFAGIAMCFFAENIRTVTILWGIVYGIGFGFSFLLLPAIVNDYFFKYRSIALGMSYLGCAMGFFVFPPIFEILSDEYGLSGTFLILSGICMHCVPLSMFLTKPSFRKDSRNLQFNKDRKQTMYSSVNYISKNIIQEPVSENTKPERQTNSTINSYLRRFSLEFLWRQPSHLSSLSNENCEQCKNVSPKGKYYGSLCRRDLSSRSYENLSHYDSLDNLISSFSSRRTLVGNTLLESEGNFLDPTNENLKYKTNINDKDHKCHYFCDCIFVKELNSSKDSVTKIKEARNITNEIMKEKLRLPQSEKHYREFSTIYFGTENAPHVLPSHESNIGHKSVSSEFSNENVCEDYTHKCYSRSVEGTSTHNYFPRTSSTNPNSVDGLARELPILAKISSYDTRSIENHILEKNSNMHHNSMFRMYFNPIFIIMCIVNSLYNLSFNTMLTIIIDFSRDQHIDASYEKYIMMCISVMGICGMLGFGWVTDGGYLTRSTFTSISLLIGSIAIAVLPQTVGFASLIIVLAIFSLAQASFVPLIPAIIAEYFEEDMQAVAISACNVLCGPMYLVIPYLIGYFRDGKGSYDYIFYLLSILALVNSISVFSVPFIARIYGSRKISLS